MPLTIGTVTSVAIQPGAVEVTPAVTPMQVLYLEATGGKYGLCVANDTAKDKPAFLSFAPAAALGQCCVLKNGDKVNLGVILVEGQTYYMGRTAGSIVLYTELATPDAAVRVLYAETTSIAVVDIADLTTDIIL